MSDQKKKFLETVKSIGIALVIAMAIRTWVAEPFKIPSESMVPTLLVGDHIFVNKFIYGLRIPFTKIRFWQGGDPKRGEVIIFWYPHNERLDYIKRVVGLPGDRIRTEEDKVYINGELIAKEPLRFEAIPGVANQVGIVPAGPYSKLTTYPDWDHFNIFRETLGDHLHLLQHDNYFLYPPKEIQVPEGYYFVMGDNRDRSEDSRAWGFVPRENIKGRAVFIWLSLDWNQPIWNMIRIHRFGRPIM